MQAVMSLPKVYISRNLPADQLRKQNVLSLSQTPQLMLQPTLSGQLPCEFLSLEAMHRWILCELPCHNRVLYRILSGGGEIVVMHVQHGQIRRGLGHDPPRKVLQPLRLLSMVLRLHI